MKRFEYKILRFESTHGQAKLNEVGLEGWELIKLDQIPSGNYTPGDFIGVFKRELPTPFE